MKRLTILILAVVTFIAAQPAAHSAPSVKERYAAIVVDGNTGRVLHSESPDGLRYPASLTKMMTLYMTFDALDSQKLALDDKIAFSEHAAGQPPSKIGLKPGQSITVHDAIMILATKSANDVAAALAEALGGSEWQFARKMTEKARSLGMRQTTFRNASGLPDAEQVTTARDMAILSMALYDNFPHYAHVFQAQQFRLHGVAYRNHNKLLGNYEGMVGIKTGYIRASGFNLAAAVRRNGHRLFAVVFGGRTGQSRDTRMRQILDSAFDKLNRVNVQMVMMNPPKRKPSRGPVELSVAMAAEAAVPEAQGSVDGSSGGDLDVTVGNGWAVQVGAFSDERAARRALELSQSQLPGVLAAARPYVIEHEDRFGKLYRARHVGLDERQARSACDALQKLQLACIVAPPDGSSL